MNKRRLIGCAVLAIAFIVVRATSRSDSSPWETMIERMSDSAPPEWMFNNISVIRENADRILERLAEPRSVNTLPTSV